MALANSDVKILAAAAKDGDKRAQLELGKRFESGNGVPVDIRQAIKLYRLASKTDGGPVWIYVPSPGNGVSGQVQMRDDRPISTGLEEARKRLEILTSHSPVN